MIHKKFIPRTILCSVMGTLTACSSGSRVQDGSATLPRVRSGVVATIDGRAVTMEHMLPSLMEASGAAVLEELVVDTALRARAQRAGVGVDEQHIQAEHARLIALLREQVDNTQGWTSAELIEQLQQSRGMGKVRYRALLERTALLRAVASSEVVVREGDLMMAYDRAHGTKYDVRLITVDSALEGQSVLARLAQGEAFAQVAARLSTHTSASGGGTVGVLSTGDTGVPSVIREVLPKLAEGEHSSVLALDRGVAVVQVTSVISGDGTTLDAARETLTQEVREELVRQRMALLAQELLTKPSVTVHDPALDHAWRNRQQ